MGAEAAVNAVFANKIAEKPEAERAAYVEELRVQYRADIRLKGVRRLAEPLFRRSLVKMCCDAIAGLQRELS